MPSQLSLDNSFCKFLVYAIAVAAFGIFPVSSANAQTNWIITVTGIGTNSKPTYDVVPPATSPYNCAGAHPNPPPSADYLYICANDTVQWQAATTGANPSKMRNKIWIFHEDFILQDEDHDPTQGFHAMNAITKGGMTDPAATLYVPHKYHVSVYDKLTRARYYDDPTIIIGGSHLEVLFDRIERACGQLPAAIDKDPSANDDSKKRAKKEANEACEQFQKLKNFLK